MKKLLSILLVLSMVIGSIPAMEFEAKAAVPTFTQDQYDIAAWADYYYNMTWECQKTVYGWREQYTFYEGETYRIPYAQAVNSGEYIGYGISYEDFLVAAADPDNVFYSKQAEWSGWVSVYYGTDCAAFVASCWGTFRHDCSTFQYTSTEIATLTEDTVELIELGDALDSYCMGHVVLVSDLIYDDDGNLTHIEITEQTPPQLKRTLHTPESLVAKYGTYYIIYRYEGSVPAGPESEAGYTSDCTPYAAHCDLQIGAATPIMSLPCTTTTDAESTQLGTAKVGEQYVGTRLFENTAGELWYQIAMADGSEGYVLAEDATYLGQRLDDLTLTGATFPQSHVKGNTFSVTGTLNAEYNAMTEASVKIYSGFGQTGTYVTGGTDTVSGNSYTLKNSTIDYATAFNQVAVGRNTYVISATYKNYYVQDGQVLQNTGTVDLAEEYFRVVSQTVSSCAHSYASTTMAQADCDDEGKVVYDCATCGNVYTETTAALGHSYGDWTQVDATCTTVGSQTRVCGTCGHEDVQVIPALGHSYDATEVPSDCASSGYTQYTCSVCGDSYKSYPEDVMSEWTDVKPDVDESLIQTKQQYRYRDAETIVSDQEYLEGYDLLGYEWQTVSTGTNDYVSDWPSGFDKTHAYYTEYTDYVVEHQDGNQRLYLDGQPTTGFFYYHWCASGYTSSSESKSSPYTTFHVFYSTTNPADHTTYDETDDSYKFHNDVCSRSDWYFVAYVSTQQYTIKEKVYLQGHWGEWSQWSDTAEEATDTRQVESRTLYRYADATVGEHNFGQWSQVTAPGCATEGLLSRTCADCGAVETSTVAATGHDYSPVEVAASCCDYAHTAYICGTCGDTYKEYTMSDWAETIPDDADPEQVQTKEQYRYSDASTFTSSEAEVEGATQIGYQWVPYGTDKVQYVAQWPTGFDTTHELYTAYNNAANKVAEYETESEKLTIDSDQVGGYLYYHWCSASDTNHYSYAQKSSTHNIFHAYYSTVSPDTYTCDPSDMSYKTSDGTCADGNSLWFFVAEVYDQSYTISHKEYIHQTWGEWSEWGDEPVESSDTRKVETRTLYSWPVGTYGDHSYETVTVDATCTEDGSITSTCTVCGDSTVEVLPATGHDFQKGSCTVCGEKDPDYQQDYYLFGYINGANYACEEDYENMGIYHFVDGVLEVRFDSDSYIGIKLADNADWFMTQSYVTDTTATFYSTSTGAGEKMLVPGGKDLRLTVVDNGDGTLTLSYEILCSHPSHDMEGVCAECGQTVDHSYESVTVDATCTEDGTVTYTCTCGSTYTETIPAKGHSYGSVTVDVTCTEDGTITYTCTCGDTYTETIPAKGHSYDSVTVDATCTEDGTITYTCACGDTYTETIPAKGHSHESVTVDATCTEDGTITYTCACGDTYTETIPATGHSYESSVTDGTCTEGGVITYTCTCGDTYTEVLPAQGHSYETVTTDATCTEDGSVTDTCTACGDVQTQILPATGHAYDTVQIGATCTDYAHLEHTCGTCGYSYKEYTMSDWLETVPEGVDPQLVQSKLQYRYRDSQTITSAETSVEGYEQTGSSWVASGTGTVTYVPSWPAGFDTSHSLYTTYDKAGDKVTAFEEETRKRTVDSDALVGYLYYHWCSASDTDHYSYAQKSSTHNVFHAYYSTVSPDTYLCDPSDMSYKTSDSTCADGNSLWFFVTEVYEQSYTDYEKQYIHTQWSDWSDWSDEEPQAAEGRQVESRTLYSYPVGQLADHSYEVVTVDATCTTDGSTTSTCTVCGDSTVEVLPALGHSYEVVTVEATCTADGSVTSTCTVCGDSTVEVLPALGHSYEVVTVDPTCTTDGSVTSTCTVCGDSTVEVLPALGHSHEVVTVDPTCTADGSTTSTCTVCGDSTVEVLPALGHSHEVVTVDPTCTADGSTTSTCTVCGDSTVEVLPALGHSYEVVTVDATCTADGSTTSTCTVCGDSTVEVLPALGHSYGTWTIGTMPTCETEGEMYQICGDCQDKQTAPVAALGHSYSDGSCTVCGAVDPNAVVDPGLTLKYPSLSFEDEIFYNVYFTVGDMSSVEELGLMLLPSRLTDATIDDAIGLVPGYQTNGTVYMVRSEGIAAAYMGDTMYFKIYAKLTDGSYAYSTAGGYNAKAYANTVLSGDYTDEMKSLVVAMVNYGAEAQLYFEHSTDKLVNAALTDDQKALVSAYDEAMVDAVVTADSSKTANFVRVSSNFKTLYPSVSFDSAFSINFYCTPAITVDSGMTLYYWDAETYNSITEFTVDNATGSMEMTENGGQYWGNVPGIAAKDMDKTYYVSCVFESEGETITTGIIAYSLGKYCEGKAATDGDAQQAFAQATAVYGYYAKQYFASIA